MNEILPSTGPFSEKYSEWYLTRGSARGRPLDATTLSEDRKIFRFLLRSNALDLDTFAPEDARRYLFARLARREVEVGRLNAISKALRRWLRYRDGEDVDLPTWREPDPKMKALTADQKFVAFGYRHPNAVQDARDRFVLALALTSGLEPGEAAPLNVQDIDIDQGGIYVHHPVKGHRRGFVPLPASVLTHPKRPSFQNWMKHRIAPKDEPDALLTTCGSEITGDRRPRRMTPPGLSAVLQRVRRETGVPINWQVARHTIATDLLEAEYGERYVMHFLRLTSMTHLPRYAEARPAAMLRRYRKLRGLDPFKG